MSTATKNPSMKGVRYTADQKKEIVDYAMNHNAEHGRGGQSKAAEKFNVSQLTIATWLKNAGAPPSKMGRTKKPQAAAKTAKAAKPAKKDGRGRKSRYSDDQKKEITDFVTSHNAANGRGGASTASKKFGVSPLTVMSWLKQAGIGKKASKAAKKGAAKKAGKSGRPMLSGGLSGKLNSLLALSEEIASTEAELKKMRDRFDSLKASL